MNQFIKTFSELMGIIDEGDIVSSEDLELPSEEYELEDSHDNFCK
ncbi:MAG: hypothetical protein RSF88_06065 [Lachnospiraceae bacterium]